MSTFLKKFALLALALLAACSDPVTIKPPPLDQLLFPTGLALTKAPASALPLSQAGDTTLLIVSSNWDLHYSHGTVMAVNADLALRLQPGGGRLVPPGSAGPTAGVPAQMGVAEIGSSSAQIRIVDSSTCPNRSAPPSAPAAVAEALVPSRADAQLYRVPIAADGTLTCADGACGTAMAPPEGQPFDVAIACTHAGGSSAARQLAFLSYLSSTDGHAWVTQLDLAAADPKAPGARIDRDITATTFQPSFDPTAALANISVSPTSNLVWDAGRNRLYLTSREQTLAYAPLYWFDLLGGADELTLAPTRIANLFSLVRGAAMRAMVLSQDGSRAFVVLPIYDASEASRTGAVITTGAALGVFDLAPLDGASAPNGVLPRLVDLVPIDLGASELVRLPFRGGAERIAIASMNDGTLSIYDDGLGRVVKVFGLNPSSSISDFTNSAAPIVPANLLLPGNPVLGKTLWGLAAESKDGKCLPYKVVKPDGTETPHDAPAACDRIYVSSFGQNVVTVVELDPAAPQDAHYVGVIGEATWPQ